MCRVNREVPARAIETSDKAGIHGFNFWLKLLTGQSSISKYLEVQLQDWNLGREHTHTQLTRKRTVLNTRCYHDESNDGSGRRRGRSSSTNSSRSSSSSSIIRITYLTEHKLRISSTHIDCPV